MQRIGPEFPPCGSSILLPILMLVLLHIEEQAVVMMHSCCEFMHSEERMDKGYFHWDLENVLVVD